MRGIIFGLVTLFYVSMAAVHATILTPTILSWGLEGAHPTGPYLPGDAITASLNVTATRTNPSQDQSVVVDVYFSRTQNNTAAPAVHLGTITASVPGGSSGGGPTARNTFTLPQTFNGLPLTSGTYYLVFVANGTTGTDTRSSSFTVQVPDIAVEQPAGTNLTDGTSTVAFGAAPLSGNVSRTSSSAIPI